jgi:hypothetical protein
MSYLSKNKNEYFADRIIMGYETNNNIPISFIHEKSGKILRVSMMIEDKLWPAPLVKNQEEFKKTLKEKAFLKTLKSEYREEMRNKIPNFKNKSDYYSHIAIPGIGVIKKKYRNELIY